MIVDRVMTINLRRVCAALAAAVVLANGTPAPAADDALLWGPCVEDGKPIAGAECGKLKVPVSWTDPSKGTLDLSTVRIKAAGPGQRLGVLVTDWGGPAGASAATLLDDGRKKVSTQLRQRFDLVAIDEREGQLACDASLEQNLANKPGSPAQFADMKLRNERYAQSCQGFSPAHLADNVDSLSRARDLDALRAKLAEEQISFYGVSYGTVTGQAYAQLFPQRVRAMVLDGVMYHNYASTKDYLVDAAAGLEDAFRGFIRWCQTHKSGPNSCAELLTEAGESDLEEHFTSLFHAASRNALVTPDPPSVVTRDALTSLFSHVYASKDSPFALAELAGSLARMKVSVRRSQSGLEPHPWQVKSGDSQTVLRCADWSDDSLSTHAKLVATWDRSQVKAPSMQVSKAHWDWMRNCVGSGIPQRYAPAFMPGTVPALIVSFRFDTATFWAWADKLANSTGAPMVTYDGWGHGAYDNLAVDGEEPARVQGRECVRAFVDNFLQEAAHLSFDIRPVCRGATSS